MRNRPIRLKNDQKRLRFLAKIILRMFDKHFCTITNESNLCGVIFIVKYKRFQVMNWLYFKRLKCGGKSLFPFLCMKIFVVFDPILFRHRSETLLIQLSLWVSTSMRIFESSLSCREVQVKMEFLLFSANQVGITQISLKYVMFLHTKNKRILKLFVLMGSWIVA